jgi:hypothetical protein
MNVKRAQRSVKLMTNAKVLMMKIWPLLIHALKPSEQGDKIELL